MTMRRASTGGRIDRTRTVRFTFDGKAYTGHAGDTLASALMAAGVSVFARSFKYHRPRGVFGCGPDEPNALVTLIAEGVREPNVQATMVEIFDGLDAESQNRFPSLGFDIGAVNGLAGPLISAGFYYKTFMGPVVGPIKGTRAWMLAEKAIRRAAGLGRAGHAPDPARYERVNAFCDTLVVGSGPAGLVAAESAAAAGGRVILADLDATMGGTAKWSSAMIDGRPAAEWAAGRIAALAAMPNVRLLPRTTVWGYYDGNTLAATEWVSDHKSSRAKGEPRQRSWTIRAGAVVLAMGAQERPIVFPGNDRPGVMLAGAALRYAGEFAVLPAGPVVIFTNNDSAYTAAAGLAEAGAEIAAIVDVRPETSDAARALADKAGGELLTGHAIVHTHGGKALSSVSVRRFTLESGTFSGETRRIEAGCLAVSGGWSPMIHLASQAGGKPAWSETLQAFLPPEPTQDWTAVGAADGTFRLADIVTGAEAPELDPAPAPCLEIASPGKAFVDFQHDVTADDVRLAHREGFASVEHLKRYTTLGMATDQGRTSNIPGMAIMAAATGRTIAETGTTRFRPPFSPVSIAAIAADRHGDLRPERRTPLHDWHVERGAIMQPAGLWHRPRIYDDPGETVEQAYVREAKAVRERVGIVDVSTLGKIAVQGPDAAAFLDRVYTNMFSTLKVGRARYGLMLREDGFPYDDGTTWRLSETDFLMTTTTANAGRVMQNLEYWLDTSWPDLRVALTSVTDQWAGAAVAGPKSREVLAACITGTGVDDDALPFMGIVHGEIAGVPVMICRLSFSGELAYEVYCGAGHGRCVWEALMEAGEPHHIVPYGLEALGTLRIEKGHVTATEIDGRTTARDLHLDWMLSGKKPFIGSALMDREALLAPDRLGLVGLVSLDGRALNAGAHIVERGDREARDSIGHVTAVCFSPALGKYVGLALIRGGKARIGSRAHLSDPLRDRFGPVEIVSHHFFDPDGSRMHG